MHPMIHVIVSSIIADVIGIVFVVGLKKKNAIEARKNRNHIDGKKIRLNFSRSCKQHLKCSILSCFLNEVQ